MNKVYLLTRATAYVGYDEYDSKCVLAPDKKTARKLANERSGDEGSIWTNSVEVICEEIDLNSMPRVLVASFNAG